MSYRLIIRSDAQRDLADIVMWYDRQEAGLGNYFLMCVDAALEALKRNPEIHRIIRKEYRRVLVRKFPVGIFFIVKDKTIYVDVIIDLRKNPREIRDRTK